MRTLLQSEWCRKWLSGGSWLLAAMCLVGCSGVSTTSDFNAAKTTDVEGNYPESVLTKLPSKQIAEMDTFSAQVSLPDTIPFQGNEELSSVYSDWYRTGYAFAFVTGVEHLRDQVSREKNSALERAKISGWFDGNSAGGLARRFKDIDAAVGQIRSNRNSSMKGEQEQPEGGVPQKK